MGGEQTTSLSLREMGLRKSSLISFFYQIKELSQNKDLLLQLTKREIAAKYRQSLLGLSWSVIEPVLLAITYYFLFVILRGNSDPMYAVWILLGVLTWVASPSDFRGSIFIIYEFINYTSGLFSKSYLPMCSNALKCKDNIAQ